MKLPYYASYGKSIRANMQNGRAGAGAMYFTVYDPEIQTLMKLKNPMSVEDRRNRDMDYGLIHNKFFARKVARNEEYFLFNCFTAPDLHEAIWNPDESVFEALYAKYEADPNFKKTYLNARDVIRTWIGESFTTGHAHMFMSDEVNRHTPFKDTIYTSNLCVAPETTILTKDHGYVPIVNVAGQELEIWNGEEWSLSQVVKTGENQELWKVTLSNGVTIDATPYHRWYIVDQESKEPVEQRTHELLARLNKGETVYLIDTVTPLESHYNVRVERVENLGRVDDTYCAHEPLRNMIVLNGQLTSNCNEIYLPTKGYETTADLYQNGPVAKTKIAFRTPDGLRTNTFITGAPLKRCRLVDITRILEEETIDVTDLKPGDRYAVGSDDGNYYGSYEFDHVISVKHEPEVALCNLAALIPTNINNEEEYASAAYYALLMIDKTIHLSTYVLPHVGYTAKQRMSAGVGLMDIAHLFARKRLRFDSPEGLAETHRIAERHMYHLIRASLRLGKELGNAPWIHKTKWVEGWLPIDTYNRNVDRICSEPLHYDWETLRQEIIENGGIRNSVVGAIMPGESSSKAMGCANAVYPVRETSMKKSDNELSSYWVAPFAEKYRDYYQSAWDVPMEDYVNYYAVYQKFLDQGGSWDLFRRIEHGDYVGSDEVLKVFLRMHSLGLKGRYYQNSHTSAPLNFHHISDDIDVTMEEIVECIRERYSVEPNTTLLSMYADIVMQEDSSRIWDADSVVDVIMGRIDVQDLVTESAGCAGGGCKL